MDFLVEDYKALGLKDTEAINKAILDCSKDGGRVVLQANTKYKVGTICLKSNVELHFEDYALLEASDNVADFDPNGNSASNFVKVPTYENCDYNGKPNKFFICAFDCENIKITGNGIIDGNEKIFYGEQSKWFIDGYFYPRVPMLFLENCKNVLLENITLRHSAFWTTHLVGCDTVEVSHVNIFNNLKMANCDGIDPDHCKNLYIHDTYIEAADDCIVFKTTEANKKYGALENVEIANCTLISTSAAIKFGTESTCDFRNINVHDVNILRSNRAISFQLRDEGNIYDAHFKNINIDTRRFSTLHYWGKAEPIAITAVRRKKTTNLGYIKNITFENINANTENGVFIHGEDTINISDIKINNFNMVIKKKTHWEQNTHDLRPSEEYGLVYNDLNYFYIKNAKDISICKANLKLDDSMKEYFKEPYFVENAKNISK